MLKTVSFMFILMMILSLTILSSDECQQSYTIKIANDYDYSTVHNICVKPYSQITFTINGIDCKDLNFTTPGEITSETKSSRAVTKYYKASEIVCPSGSSSITFLNTVSEKLPESSFSIQFIENKMIKALPFKIIPAKDKDKNTIAVIINRVDEYATPSNNPQTVIPSNNPQTSNPSEKTEVTYRTVPVFAQLDVTETPKRSLLEYYLSNTIFLTKEIKYSNDIFEAKITSLITTIDKSYLYLSITNLSQSNITLDNDVISEIAYNSKRNPLSFYKWDCYNDSILNSSTDVCAIEFDHNIPQIFTIDVFLKDGHQITYKRPNERQK